MPMRVQKVEVPSAPQVRVGLWGAPNSGKTTFLASLFLAADQLHAGTRTAPIAVQALDRPSEEFKRRYSLMLAAGRRFPEATATVSAPLQWQLTGDLRGVDIADRKWWWSRRRHVPLDFVLRMRDIPGEAFRDALHAGPDTTGSGYSSALDLVGELADCQGLVYLFDPSREAYNADSYAYFEGVLTQLKRRVASQNGLVSGLLPHHLSVCVTKFDDARTFAESLRLTSLVKIDRNTGQPHIPRRHAEEYFHEICAGTKGTAEDVRDAIRANFLPENTKYYAVSAVGFSTGQDGKGWNPLVPSNTRRGADGISTIIGDRPRPINVLESVIDLERGLRATNQP
jgi:hypothetical protein